MTPQSDIGLIGLAVMGENLALNIESKGFPISVYNRTASKVDEFMAGRAQGKKFFGAHTLPEFVASLKLPRKIILLVKAGTAVDELIDQLVPLLAPGDILIDGGNSHFPDTIRRTQSVESQGLLYVGSGVSGGEEGALNDGMPLTLIGEAVFARCLSAVKEERVAAAQEIKGKVTTFKGDQARFVKDLQAALYASKIVSYAQGYQLMRAAAKTYRWNLNYGGIALVWRGGCIIRSVFLGEIKKAFQRNPGLVNLLVDKYFKKTVSRQQAGWRRVIIQATKLGIPVPCLSSALAYFDGYRSARLPANLLQAQRDYFGAHTYERVDKPRGEVFHTNWTGRGGNTTSQTYTV